MTRPTDLKALQLIAGRSPEGMGVPASTLQEAGVDVETVRNLQLEGLLEVVDDDGEVTVAVTDAGRFGPPTEEQPVMARRFHEWAASTSVPNEPQDAYDLYLEAHEHEARRDFDAGGHEYATFEDYLADDPPMTWSDFFSEWYHEQEAQSRELGWRSA